MKHNNLEYKENWINPRGSLEQIKKQRVSSFLIYVNATKNTRLYIIVKKDLIKIYEKSIVISINLL